MMWEWRFVRMAYNRSVQKIFVGRVEERKQPSRIWSKWDGNINVNTKGELLNGRMRWSGHVSCMGERRDV